MTPTKKILPLLLALAVSICGCGSIDEETVSKEEIDAAKDIDVSVTFYGTGLNFDQPLRYIRGPRLIIEGSFQNTGYFAVRDVGFSIDLYDENGNRIEARDVFSEARPDTVFPNSAGRYKIDLPAAGVKTVRIEAYARPERS